MCGWTRYGAGEWQPPPVQIRKMVTDDFNRGFLDVISALSPTEMDFNKQKRVFFQRRDEGILTYVAAIGNRVVGTASLLLETKYIHRGGRVGHIEDVAVLAGEQRHGIGTALVRRLVHVAGKRNCYKVILDCADEVIPFYEQLGFRRWETTMRVDLPPTGKEAGE